MRLPARALAGLLLAGLSATCTRRVDPAVEESASSGAGALSDPSDASVEQQRVEASELAWLVAHLADDPSPTHLGESDNVVRLAARGAAGARAAAEVFRVGDARRAPFARRVIERVALRRCRPDRGDALELIVWIQRPEQHADRDAGFAWLGDDPHWPAERLARLIDWTERGAPCPWPVAGSDGGVGEGAPDAD